ncbi:DUF2206 domain-containing protein [Methanothermobacter sp. K4]|uniref:DUF2206 domain-containing protein n=1 Tax=Methanothermobacter sp. K4 TaxID=2913262 RepID=UPI001EDB78B8|nr:DUF2206 domain-containing protein [Methanothermobacter sp. K4]MCG2829234.1 DUF2206 domain-containing protein [Methanothermobacter sp. K4]
MRKDIFYLLILLALVDITILMDIPVLRQSIPFIFFNIVPGYLLVKIMRLDLELLEKSLLSAGLSISLLIFTGFLLNSTYPIISKPITIGPVLVALNILIFILLTGYYLRSEPSEAHKFNSGNTLFSPVMLSLVFPVLTVIGSYLMNTYHINTVLLGVLLIIPIYLIILTLLGERLHHSAYPMALFNIGLSLLIMNGLPSNYLIGRDIHTEYYLFRTVIMNGYWSVSGAINNAYNACLSITILPAIYRLILDVPAVYIFKLYYGFIGAIMPLAVYLISERILKDRTMAFYAALLFIFQFSFIYILGWCRQLIALVFFSLAIMVLTSSLRRRDKKILFIIFMVSTVLSHYTTAYVFAILTILIPPVAWLIKRFSIGRPKRSYFFGVSVAVLFFVVVFAWYAQATGAPFDDAVKFFKTTFSSMADFFAADMRNNAEQSVVGIGIAQLPNFMSVMIHDTVFFLIAVGFLSIIFHRRDDINREYTAVILISMGLLASFIILPFISKGYGGTRLFTQMLVILAPLFIMGIQELVSLLKRQSLKLPIILLVLVLLFSCVSYLNYHFAGIPYSYAYNSEGERRYETFIFTSEVTAAKWLSSNGGNFTVNTDTFGYSRILQGFYNPPKLNTEFFTNETKREKGYIYLRWANVNRGLVFLDSPGRPPRFIGGKLKMDNVEPIGDYKNLIGDKDRIYDNGGTLILGGS